MKLVLNTSCTQCRAPRPIVVEINMYASLCRYCLENMSEEIKLYQNKLESVDSADASD